jgi:N-acetyl-anhydromuramyl-L-alanine amidase AmpD
VGREGCTPDRGDSHIDTVIIHVTESNDWRQIVRQLDGRLGVTVHYIVGRDGHVRQLLCEEATAWHSGNDQFNARSIGIEHVGLTDGRMTDAQYRASARLVAYLVKKYRISVDREHILGHYQVPRDARGGPCSTSRRKCILTGIYGGAHGHRDPGPLWNWASYMSLLAGR